MNFNFILKQNGSPRSAAQQFIIGVCTEYKQYTFCERTQNTQNIEAQLMAVNGQLVDLQSSVKEAKEQQNDIIELQSDVTEIKIDMQKLRQTVQ